MMYRAKGDSQREGFLIDSRLHDIVKKVETYGLNHFSALAHL